MTEIEAQNYLIWSGKIISFLMFVPLLVMLWNIRFFSKTPYVFLLIARIVNILVNLFIVWLIAFTSEPQNYERIKHILVKFEISNTSFVDPVLYLETFIFVGLFLYFSVSSKKVKRTILLVSLICIVFTVYNSVYGETYKRFQSWGSIINNLYVVGAGALLISIIFKGDLRRRLSRIPEFYFAVSFIISGLVCGLLDFVSNAMFKETSVLFFQLNTVKNLFILISVLFTAYGAFLIRRKRSFR